MAKGKQANGVLKLLLSVMSACMCMRVCVSAPKEIHVNVLFMIS